MVVGSQELRGEEEHEVALLGEEQGDIGMFATGDDGAGDGDEGELFEHGVSFVIGYFRHPHWDAIAEAMPL